ncbi:hypothetical protein ABT373_28560 [Streptomyces sp. NPDC000070]|uniref:hypothetical protein n=1 Tax=Streptomyces sp. NPDC000070 TaxID=3154240 RepID=UPI003333C048
MRAFREAVEALDLDAAEALLAPDVVFTSRREINGCDFIHVDEDGLIDELTVMVRPLSAAQALAAAMGAQFERIAEEARARSV